MKGKTCKISHTKGDKEYKSPPITWYFLSNESFLAASSPPNYYQGVVDMGKKKMIEIPLCEKNSKTT